MLKAFYDDFVTAILQCLNHTDMLAEYFVTDQYRSDLNRKGRLMSARKFGTRGEVTEQLAGLLKALWSSQYEPEMTFKLKSVIDKYGAQYRGAAQHDAQEFLLWLLDKVHEDLNTATKKKYKKVKVGLLFFLLFFAKITFLSFRKCVELVRATGRDRGS